MRRIFIFSAGVLTLGVAVVVGSIFAQTLAPGSAPRPTPAAPAPAPAQRDNIALPTAGYPHANTARIASSPSPNDYPTQASPGFGNYDPAGQANAVQRSLGGYQQVYSTASTTDDGSTRWNTPDSFQQNASAQPMRMEVHSRTVPDPDNPGRSKEVQYYRVVPDQSISPFAPTDESTLEIARLLQELRQDRQSPANPANPEKLQILRKLLADQFEKRHQSQVTRLEKIHADVQRTRAILDLRDQQRDEIIDRRIAQLLGQQDPLQWDYQPDPSQPQFPNSNDVTQLSRPLNNPNSLPRMAPLSAEQRPTYPQPYAAPSAPTAPTTPDQELNRAAQLDSSRPVLETPQEFLNTSDSLTPPRSPEVNDLLELARRIQQSRKILDESAGLDNTVADFSRPNPHEVKEQLAQSETELHFYIARLLHATKLKELDLADAQMKSEEADIVANNTKRLFSQKIIAEPEMQLAQIKADAAKSAVLRAEIELNEIDQQLQWLKLIGGTPSQRNQFQDEGHNFLDALTPTADSTNRVPTDEPTSSSDDSLPADTSPAASSTDESPANTPPQNDSRPSADDAVNTQADGLLPPTIDP